MDTNQNPLSRRTPSPLILAAEQGYVPCVAGLLAAGTDRIWRIVEGAHCCIMPGAPQGGRHKPVNKDTFHPMNRISDIPDVPLSGELAHDRAEPGWLDRLVARWKRSRHLRCREQRLCASVDLAREYGKAFLGGQDADLLAWVQSQSAKLCEHPWFWIGGEVGSGRSFLLHRAGARSFEESVGVMKGDRRRNQLGNVKLWQTNETVFLEEPTPRLVDADDQEALRLAKLDVARVAPVDGILVTVPWEVHAGDVARRQAVNAWLTDRFHGVCQGAGQGVPVWFIVTKCDHLPGFSEFAATLPSDAERNQMLGWVDSQRNAAQLESSYFSAKLADLAARIVAWSQVNHRAEAEAETLAASIESLQVSLSQMARQLLLPTGEGPKKGKSGGGPVFAGVFLTACVQQPPGITVADLAKGRLSAPNSPPSVFVGDLFRYLSRLKWWERGMPRSTG